MADSTERRVTGPAPPVILPAADLPHVERDETAPRPPTPEAEDVLEQQLRDFAVGPRLTFDVVGPVEFVTKEQLVRHYLRPTANGEPECNRGVECEVRAVHADHVSQLRRPGRAFHPPSLVERVRREHNLLPAVDAPCVLCHMALVNKLWLLRQTAERPVRARLLNLFQLDPTEFAAQYLLAPHDAAFAGIEGAFLGYDRKLWRPAPDGGVSGVTELFRFKVTNGQCSPAVDGAERYPPANPLRVTCCTPQGVEWHTRDDAVGAQPLLALDFDAVLAARPDHDARSLAYARVMFAYKMHASIPSQRLRRFILSHVPFLCGSPFHPDAAQALTEDDLPVMPTRITHFHAGTKPADDKRQTPLEYLLCKMVPVPCQVRDLDKVARRVRKNAAAATILDRALYVYLSGGCRLTDAASFPNLERQMELWRMYKARELPDRAIVGALRLLYVATMRGTAHELAMRETYGDWDAFVRDVYAAGNAERMGLPTPSARAKTSRRVHYTAMGMFRELIPFLDANLLAAYRGLAPFTGRNHSQAARAVRARFATVSAAESIVEAAKDAAVCGGEPPGPVMAEVRRWLRTGSDLDASNLVVEAVEHARRTSPTDPNDAVWLEAALRKRSRRTQMAVRALVNSVPFGTELTPDVLARIGVTHNGALAFYAAAEQYAEDSSMVRSMATLLQMSADDYSLLRLLCHVAHVHFGVHAYALPGDVRQAHLAGRLSEPELVVRLYCCATVDTDARGQVGCTDPPSVKGSVAHYLGGEGESMLVCAPRKRERESAQKAAVPSDARAGLKMNVAALAATACGESPAVRIPLAGQVVLTRLADAYRTPRPDKPPVAAQRAFRLCDGCGYVVQLGRPTGLAQQPGVWCNKCADEAKHACRRCEGSMMRASIDVVEPRRLYCEMSGRVEAVDVCTRCWETFAGADFVRLRYMNPQAWEKAVRAKQQGEIAPDAVFDDVGREAAHTVDSLLHGAKAVRVYEEPKGPSRKWSEARKRAAKLKRRAQARRR